MRRKQQETGLPSSRTQIPPCDATCPSFSSLSSEEMAYHFREPGKLSRYTPPHKESMAVVVQTKARRHAKCPPGRQIPGRDRRDVLRGIVQSRMVAVAERAVHFDAGREVLRAKTAPIRRRLQRQRAAGAHGVPKLPGIARQVFCGKRVDRKIPSFVGLR